MKDEAERAAKRWREYAQEWRELRERTPSSAPTMRARQEASAEAFDMAAEELEAVLGRHP